MTSLGFFGGSHLGIPFLRGNWVFGGAKTGINFSGGGGTWVFGGVGGLFMVIGDGGRLGGGRGQKGGAGCGFLGTGFLTPPMGFHAPTSGILETFWFWNRFWAGGDVLFIGGGGAWGGKRGGPQGCMFSSFSRILFDFQGGPLPVSRFLFLSVQKKP